MSARFRDVGMVAGTKFPRDPDSWCEFVAVIEGDLIVHVDGRPWPVWAGCGIWIPADQAPKIEATSDTVLTCFSAGWLEQPVYRLCRFSSGPRPSRSQRADGPPSFFLEACSRIRPASDIHDNDYSELRLLRVALQELENEWYLDLTPPPAQDHSRIPSRGIDAGGRPG